MSDSQVPELQRAMESHNEVPHKHGLALASVGLQISGALHLLSAVLIQLFALHQFFLAHFTVPTASGTVAPSARVRSQKHSSSFSATPALFVQPVTTTAAVSVDVVVDVERSTLSLPLPAGYTRYQAQYLLSSSSTSVVDVVVVVVVVVHLSVGKLLFLALIAMLQ
jgi:hypothetical protein